MKKIIFCLLLISPCWMFAQIGIKAGLNFANVSNASSINSSSTAGFNIGLFLAPSSKRIISSKTEIIFSRQGYNYKTNSNTGNVNLDYIMMPTYMCINITKFFEIHFGAQMAYLINAKADSTNNSGSGGPYGQIMNYYNRFDYGYGGGVEIHPVKGLVIGSRVNISLAKLYSDALSGQMPSFSSIDVKNNLFQLYAGWRFGKTESKKEKKQ